MDLALDNLEMSICHKTKTTNQPDTWPPHSPDRNLLDLYVLGTVDGDKHNVSMNRFNRWKGLQECSVVKTNCDFIE